MLNSDGVPNTYSAIYSSLSSAPVVSSFNATGATTGFPAPLYDPATSTSFSIATAQTTALPASYISSMKPPANNEAGFLFGPSNFAAGHAGDPSGLQNIAVPGVGVQLSPTQPITGNGFMNNVSFSSGLTVGEHLSEELKNDIRNNKYVNFFDIKFPESEQSFDMSFSKDGKPGIRLLPRRRRPLAEREWEEAFADFMAVYVQAHPYSTNDLLTYNKYVHSLMRKYPSWEMYDMEFRRDKEKSGMPWTHVRADLVLKLVASYRSGASSMGRAETGRSKGNGAARSARTHVPRGYCYDYHNPGSSCADLQRCTYSHKCPFPKCGGSHPLSNCKSKDPYPLRYDRPKKIKSTNPGKRGSPNTTA